ncbi:YggS family pyridoxal phosphate-dependent enzyme [Spirochaeta dissipatitropha]
MNSEKQIPDTAIAYNQAHQEIAAAAEAAGRNPEEVRILLATKTVEANRIIEAIEAGAGLIAENRVQEAIRKLPELRNYICRQETNLMDNNKPKPCARQHFIGHLQSNKIKDLLTFASMLHSLDRESLAFKLNKALEQAPMNAPVPFPVLVQVNTSGEQSKFGVDPADALQLVDIVHELPMLALRGFMTIGLFSEDRDAVRKSFADLRIIRDRAQERCGCKFPELSMGMSGDYDLAIAEGATIVRLGSRIFGSRPAPPSPEA